MADLFQQNNTLEYFQDRSETERQNQINVINSFVSPEFLEAEKEKGKVTAFETLSNAKKWGYAVPYIGTGASIGESLKIKHIQDKASEGIQLTPEEMNTYKEFVLDIASLSARGQTIPSMAFDGFLQSIPYAVEMGVGLATAGEGVGLASLGQTGAKIGVKQALKQGVIKTTKEAVKNKLANTTAKTLLRDTTVGVGKFNMKYLPQQGVKRFGEIEVDNNLYLTPEGKVLLNEAETNPAISVLKALAMTHIETLSETAGYAFTLGKKTLGSVIHSKVLDKLPKSFAKNFDKLAKDVTGLTGFKALEKYGFNGLLEEFGEERVADLLKVTFNLDDQEGYSFDQFVGAMFPPKEQAIAELLSFALMGGAGVGIKKTADYSRYKTIANDIKNQSLKKDGTYNLTRMKKLIKQSNPSISAANLDKAINSIQNGILKTKDYSVDDFLLDCGVFRLHAKKSITDERLTKILEKGGVKEEDIEEFLDFASNDDKAQLVKMHEKANKKPQEDYSDIKKGLVQSGRTEEQAEYEVGMLNKIDEVMLDKYNDEGQAEELIKKRNLKLNVEKTKEKYAPVEETSNYEQVMEEARLHTINTGETTRVKKDEKGDYFYTTLNSDGTKPVIKYTVKLNESGNSVYLETEKYHTNGEAAYLKEFVEADTTKVEKAIEGSVRDEAAKGLDKFFDDASEFSYKLEDLGKQIQVGAMRHRVFKAGEYEKGKPYYVYVQTKYLLDKKGYELFQERELNTGLISIRKNGQQIGIVMPIINVKANETDFVDVPKMAENTISTNSTNSTLETFTAENTQEFAPEEKPEPIDKYEDFGEKIHGAKKDLWKTYQKALEKALSEDIEQISLTKDFPEPNYEFLIREGVSVDVLAIIKALRDCIPTKPRGRYNSYKRKEYVETVKFVRNLAVQMIKGNIVPSRVKEALNKQHDIYNLVDLYIELGYPAFKNAKGIKLLNGVTAFYKDGKRLDTPLKNQFMFAKNGRFFGNSFDTREEAIEYMRGILSAEPEKQEKKTKLDIYQVRRTGEIIIGKKVGTNKWIDLKGGFTKTKEAREYYQEHEAELLELLKKKKETPETRHSANRDRIGADYREGMNITPEKFANEFGFRGVQFGNYVEQKKRVDDINEAYDALLDLANLLDIPSRAISLNGSLGIAFGARGSGGKNPAKAHYEPDEVVINLTKNKGAGSLAHEWWHALDNYFIKKEGQIIGYITERYVSEKVRKEVLEAFRNVAKVVRKNMFERSSNLDMTRTNDYWSTTREMTARAFEAYIIGKAQLKGFTNDYLANILTEQEFNDIASYPYPLESEMQEIINAYDNLFSLLKTVETEKGIAFYQPARKPDYVDLTYEFKKTPSIKELEDYINEIIESGKKFSTLSPDWFVDIKKEDSNRRQKRITDKITNKGNFQSLNKQEKKRHNKYIMSLEKLLANAKYIGEKENTKDRKSFVEKYHYFKTNVKIGDKFYEIIFDTEEYKNDKSSLSNYANKRSSKKPNEDINSINDNKQDFNPKTVHLYNISEKKKSTSFNQAAYHGSPHRFDEFSTEYIGSGEGAQAHGWGIYTAQDKEVSDGYRKRLTNFSLTKSLDEEINDILINNKPLLDTYDIDIDKSILNVFRGKDKISIINQLNFKIKNWETTLKETTYPYKEYAEDKISEYNRLKKDIENNAKIDFANIGQLYKVDIPEDDVLLDEDKTFSEQSEFVQNALMKLAKKEVNAPYGFARSLPDLDAKQIYNRLSIAFHGDKEASLKLNEYGIKGIGITYDGRQDGRCYVIFDDKAVKILEKYYQDMANAPRAKIEFNNNETIISLMQGNDASSVMHELAHLYLHDLQELAKVNKRAEKDLKEVYKMLNFDDSADYTEEQFREMHEKFARSFEAYLMNGQAPTEKMKSVFEKFKEFLQEIYHSLMDLEVEFSDEVKQCFDRLFTTDEEYVNEVLPMYQQNDELAKQINQQDTFSYKIKNNMNALKETWKSFYDTVIIPFDTRLERISPELKKILRKHTFDMTLQSKKDCDKITPFLLKIKEIKNNKTTVKLNEKDFSAYNLLSYALNNRDSYTVNKVVKELGIQKEFGAVRELLDDLHEQAQSVGLEVGYLESYYPRMVQTEKTDAFVEMFERIAREEEIDIKEQYLEAGEAEYSNVKRQIAEKDVHGLWNNADKAKLINTSIRGFGKNNILLSRIGQLKFERLIDKLTPEQQRFYEPIEKALSNYVIGARKNIEERKFFGAENKEVSKLRASIKKKRETLREIKTRTPQQAKWKEMNRLKYELAPIEIKLESISGELKNNQERLKTIKDKEEQEKIEGYIATQKETIKDLQERIERLKSQLQWVEENNALKVKNVVVKRLNEDLEDLNKQIKEILGSAEHVEDSIGRLIVDLAQKGVIHVKDERAVRDILLARFNSLRIEKFALGVRDVSTIVTLNDITNALTQITDFTFAAFKFGLFDTIQGMKKVEGLTREDLGIKNIAVEFRGASALSKWLNLQLKVIGLDLIDGFAKNTAINASVLSARKKAKANNKKFDEHLKFLFGEQAGQVKKDLIDGKITDEIIFIAFNDLADIQPITTDQMTAGYQSGFKPFYVLKTYSIKALDILRNECFSKISSGVRMLKDNDNEGKKLIAEGLKNIINLQLFMWLFGIPQDILKDIIANREIDIPEYVIDNIIIFGIFNRYLIKKTSENPANIYLENIKLPALQAVGDLWTGIQQVKKGKKKVKDLYVWSRVPVVGKMYYNWFGGKKNKRVDL